jgi:hypothetical protein
MWLALHQALLDICNLIESRSQRHPVRPGSSIAGPGSEKGAQGFPDLVARPAGHLSVHPPSHPSACLVDHASVFLFICQNNNTCLPVHQGSSVCLSGQQYLPSCPPRISVCLLGQQYLPSHPPRIFCLSVRTIVRAFPSTKHFLSVRTTIPAFPSTKNFLSVRTTIPAFPSTKESAAATSLVQLGFHWVAHPSKSGRCGDNPAHARAGHSKRAAFAGMNGIAASMLLNLTSSVRFAGPLNVDLNEITVNLVPYPRLHFLVPSMSPLAVPKDVAKMVSGPRAIDQVPGSVCLSGPLLQSRQAFRNSAVVPFPGGAAGQPR